MTSEEEIKVKEQELIEKRNLFKARLVYYGLGKTEIDLIMNDVLEIVKITASYSYTKGRLKK
jgi:hypothetical protein